MSVVAGCGGAARANQVPATSAPISVSRCGLRRRGPQLAGRRLHDGGIVSVVAGCGGAARSWPAGVSMMAVSCQSLRAAAARPAVGFPPSPIRRLRVSRCGLRRRGPRGDQAPLDGPQECQSLRAAAARPASSPAVPKFDRPCVSRCGLRRRGPLTAPDYATSATPGVSRCGLRRRGPRLPVARLPRPTEVSVVAGCGGAAR